VEGSCEDGIEPSGSIKCWEVLEGLHNWRILKKGSVLYVSKYKVEIVQTCNDQGLKQCFEYKAG
jgi:hypothetical protein